MCAPWNFSENKDASGHGYAMACENICATHVLLVLYCVIITHILTLGLSFLNKAGLGYSVEANSGRM